LCLYPKLILNKKYTANKKNGGIIPPLTDNRAKMVPVGCGKCMECRKQKARDWSIRLTEEARSNPHGKFVTLTYSDEQFYNLGNGLDIHGDPIKDAIKIVDELEGYNLDNEIARLSIRRYLERIRKINKKSIKHWFITEIGGNYSERLHIHGIMWTNDYELIKKWNYGNVWVGNYCTEATMNYIVKYLHKSDEKHKEYNPKIFCSGGIGKNYFERPDSRRNIYAGENTEDNYKTRSGHKMALPIYYRNKLYDDEQREKLWMYRLDKCERWVNGIRVDVSENMEDYYKTLEEARKINKKLGYGNDQKDWERIKYENSLRMLGQKIK
jgi:hypothetical protein